MPRRPAPDPRVKRQPLPGLLGEIERACGYAAAERFALAFGGQELYIPLAILPGHPIAQAVGTKAAKLIACKFGRAGGGGGHAFAIPLAEVEIKWNRCREMRLMGMSRNEIVKELRRRCGMTTSAAHVGQLTRDLPVPPRRRAAASPPPEPAATAPLPLFAYACLPVKAG